MCNCLFQKYCSWQFAAALHKQCLPKWRQHQRGSQLQYWVIIWIQSISVGNVDWCWRTQCRATVDIVCAKTACSILSGSMPLSCTFCTRINCCHFTASLWSCQSVQDGFLIAWFAILSMSMSEWARYNEEIRGGLGSHTFVGNWGSSRMGLAQSWFAATWCCVGLVVQLLEIIVAMCVCSLQHNCRWSHHHMSAVHWGRHCGWGKLPQTRWGLWILVLAGYWLVGLLCQFSSSSSWKLNICC